MVEPLSRRAAIDRWFDRVAERVSRLPRRAGLAASIAIIAMSAGYGAVRGGHVDTVLDFLRDVRDMAANVVGFNISQVALSGQHHLNREEILATAGVTGRASLLFFDVADARARLKTNPWIAEATVQKLLPDRLVISITEREPFALWQKAGRVGVIAGDGTVLEPYVAAPLRRPAARGRAPAPKYAPRSSWPCSTASRSCAARCGPPCWSRSGAGTCGSPTGSTCGCRSSRSTRRSISLPRSNAAPSCRAATSPSSTCRLSDRVTVQLSDTAAQARDEAAKKKQQKTKGGNA